MMRRCGGILVLALAAACGGGGSTDEELVGSWGTGGLFGGALIFTFNADGTARATVLDDDGEIDEDEPPVDGTWDADGTTLTLTGFPGNFADASTDYLVHDAGLTLGIMHPDGDVEGVVGAWEGEASQGGVTRTSRIELASDGTGHIVRNLDSNGQPVDADLTWTLDGRSLEIEYPSPLGGTTLAYVYAIPDVALGGATFVPVEAPDAP